MNDPFDDDTTDSILTGVGTGDDPALARVLDVARESFTATEPVLGTELAAFLRGYSLTGHPPARGQHTTSG